MEIIIWQQFWVVLEFPYISTPSILNFFLLRRCPESDRRPSPSLTALFRPTVRYNRVGLCQFCQQSNQNQKTRLSRVFLWSRCAGSNRRPSPYHGDALPTELQRQTEQVRVLLKTCLKYLKLFYGCFQTEQWFYF